MKIEAATREFRYNAVVLPDPDPSMSIERVREAYSGAYPEIVNAAIEGPENVGAKLVYTFARAVGTKGTSVLSRKAPHLRLGEYHPHFGGHWAGAICGEAGLPDYHLFIAPKDRGDIAALEWGGYGHLTAGAEHIHDGLANTLALIKDTVAHPAAQFCTALTIDGHSDFYLPARKELRLAEVNCAGLFERAWYFSSTQSAGDSGNAWAQLFGYGNQNDGHKGYKLRVRAVRRLVIQ